MKDERDEVLTLICEKCTREIARFRVGDVYAPLHGSMFTPKGDGYPPPFHPRIGWPYLYCPYSLRQEQRHRPTMKEDELLTRERGKIKIPNMAPRRGPKVKLTRYELYRMAEEAIYNHSEDLRASEFQKLYNVTAWQLRGAGGWKKIKEDIIERLEAVQ